MSAADKNQLKSNAVATAVIGKSGQAERLISLIDKMPGVDLRWVYYPKETVNASALPLTDDFGKIMECDAVIIASPTFTHAEYIKRLKGAGFGGYILVEKPAVSTKEETEIIRSYPDTFKKKLRVNFNFNYSVLAEELRSCGNELGRITALNVHTSHGLAFMDKYKNSWRGSARHSMGVLEMVGVHYINLAIHLFGSVEKYDIDYEWLAGRNAGAPPDTVWLHLKMAQGARVNLYHSYAGPYFNKLDWVGDNGYLYYNGLECGVFSPRETFDALGKFIAPPLVRKTKMEYSSMWSDSLARSLDDFFDHVRSASVFSESDLNTALDSMNIIFETRGILKV